jgi:hypothetical protein
MRPSCGIVAINENDQIALVGQWRYVHNKYSIEIATGGSERSRAASYASPPPGALITSVRFSLHERRWVGPVGLFLRFGLVPGRILRASRRPNGGEVMFAG